MQLVEQNGDDICFLVATDFTWAQEILPRVSWLRSLPYEVNIDEVTTTIITLLEIEVEKDVKSFKRYETKKVKITI